MTVNYKTQRRKDFYKNKTEVETSYKSEGEGEVVNPDVSVMR